MIVTHTETVPDTVSEEEAALRRQVGKRIRVERIWRDLSQDELAGKAGVTRNFVSAVERGAQGLDGYRLLRIAAIFDLTLNDLFIVGAAWQPGTIPDGQRTPIAAPTAKVSTAWTPEDPSNGAVEPPANDHPNAAGWRARRAAILTAAPSVNEDEETLRSTIGKRISNERQHYNITRRDLAAKAGVSYGFLSAVERGTQRPDLYRLRRIADALGLTMEDLFGVTGRNVWSASSDWYGTAPDEGHDRSQQEGELVFHS